MTDQQLMQIQEDFARRVGHKVDLYHSESKRLIGIFHHGAQPSPFSLIHIMNY